jgi:hypothetical protein
MATLTLASFPEELLERILIHVLAHPTHNHTYARPAWIHQSATHQSTRLSPLLVSRQLTRIALPLFYNTIRLTNPQSGRLLLETLSAHETLKNHVRSLSLDGVWTSDAAAVMRLCAGSIRSLEVVITAPPSSSEDQQMVDESYFDALSQMQMIREITVKRMNNVYLTLPRPRGFVIALAKAIKECDGWKGLHTANIAFKLSDDSSATSLLASVRSTPSSTPSVASNESPVETPELAPGAGPTAQLVHSLAYHAPSLRTFATQLPAVWNNAILTVSRNPNVEKVVLTSGAASVNAPSYPAYACQPPTSGSVTFPHKAHLHAPVVQPAHVSGIPSSGLFMMEAKRHPRLTELIKAGTPFARTRARTVGTGLVTAGSSVPPHASAATAVLARR